VSTQPKYSDHLDTIIALITNLAYAEKAYRTPATLANATSIDESEVTLVLEAYKSLFRKSKSRKSNAFYSLQLRHARKWIEEENADALDDEGRRLGPLEADSVNALLDFVVKKADHESRTSLGLYTSWLTSVAALAVAILAIAFRK